MKPEPVADALREIALRLRLMGRARHSARAYDNAARTIEVLAPAELDRLVAEGRLTELQAIGPATAAEIAALVCDGQSPRLESLRHQAPAALLEVAQVPGIDFARAEHLSAELGVTSVPELAAALATRGPSVASAVGKRSPARLATAVARYQAAPPTLLIVRARRLVRPLLTHLRSSGAIDRAELTGDARRWQEEVERIEIAVASDDADAVRRRLLDHPLVARADAPAPSNDFRLADGTAVRLHVAARARFGACLLATTGPPEHLAEMRIRSPLDPTAVGGDDEARIYVAAGLRPVAPELRDAADALAHPGDLVEAAQVAGMVHCHTTYSDGKHSVEAMARAAEKLGFGYLTITDHSPSAYYARGVSLDRLQQQWDEIAEVQERVSIRILRGVESDILKDGELDYPPDILDRLDVIIASIHSRHRLDEERMTARVVRALRQPWFKIWGHPLGRIVGHRPPIPCRMDEILAAAAESRVAFEVNGDPGRLDLPPLLIREARRHGIPFVLSSDAHSVRTLPHVELAVAMARRGGLRGCEVLNTLPVDEFCARVRPAAPQAACSSLTRSDPPP